MLRIYLCQMNATVGDISGNLRKISSGIEAAKDHGADVAVFPECALVGYPAEDLLFKSQFIDDNLTALDQLKNHCRGITAIVGFIDRREDLYNAAAVMQNGELKGVVHKNNLPNYGVFDENRYFRAATEVLAFHSGKTTFGVSICEDLWHPNGPALPLSHVCGAEILINISASPYHSGKVQTRDRMLATRASDHSSHLVFCNMVGGQDELVFDGNSRVFNSAGDVIARGLPFAEDAVVVDLDPREVFSQRLRDPRRRAGIEKLKTEGFSIKRVELDEFPTARRPAISRQEPVFLGKEEEIYRALELGCRDYARKNGFKKALLGLSGGVDSALTASIAVDALGKENVVGATMPSPHSSQGSVDDSLLLSKNLGIECKNIPIAETYQGFLASLKPIFGESPPGVAEENLQARIRGVLLMALSNKFGWLLLGTGNKSETSVGYCTLYGDMAGGFSVLKDVSKTLAYQLVEWRNSQSNGPWIPKEIIEKPPSAELRPDQKDSDSLPPYDELDPILKCYVEEDQPIESLEEKFAPETVRSVIALVDHNEYKRRQAPPGVKITPRAFGKDRRFPITNAYRKNRL